MIPPLIIISIFLAFFSIMFFLFHLEILSFLFPKKYYRVYYLEKDSSLSRKIVKKEDRIKLADIERFTETDIPLYEGRLRVLFYRYDDRMPITLKTKIEPRNIELEEKFFELKLDKMLKGESNFAQFFNKYGIWIIVIIAVVVVIFIFRKPQEVLSNVPK